MGELAVPAVVLLFLLALLVLAIMAVVRNLVHVCGPSEVLIFAGTTRQVGARTLGYRIVKGGSAIRKPLVETVDRMDLSNMQVEVRVTNAYTRGGIPVSVHGVANVKVAGEEPLLNNALERFLGKSPKEIASIARETIEGALRGVLAQLTPEQINEDKASFSATLTREAETDLERLGLVIDTLNIQNVADDVGYLTSIGRQRSSIVKRNAMVREAEMQADALEQKWKNHAVQECMKLGADLDIFRSENDRRIRKALTGREAKIAEQRAGVAAAVAQARAEVQTQQARIEQVRQQLQADIIAPADARRRAAEYRAKGQAATIVEQGRATAEVLRKMTETYTKSGGAARDVLLLQKLHPLLEAITSTIQNVHIHSMTVLGGGGADGSSSTSLAAKLVRTSEQIKVATGLDIPRLVQQKLGGDNE